MRDDRSRVITASVIAILIGVGAIIVAVRAPDLTAPAVVLGGGGIVVGAVLALVSMNDPFPKTRIGGIVTPSDDARAHVLTLRVGERETHGVSYRWDQVWGWLTVIVDDRLVARQIVLLSFRLLSVVELDVGDRETHRVRFEKRRPLMASFGRVQPITGFVDGVAVGTAA